MMLCPLSPLSFFVLPLIQYFMYLLHMIFIITFIPFKTLSEKTVFDNYSACVFSGCSILQPYHSRMECQPELPRVAGAANCGYSGLRYAVRVLPLVWFRGAVGEIRASGVKAAWGGASDPRARPAQEESSGIVTRDDY